LRSEREFDTEITEQHSDERIAGTVSGGGCHPRRRSHFHRLSDNQSRVMIQIDWEPIGLLESVGAAVNADDRQIRADTKKFKEFIENGGGHGAGWRGDIQAPS